MTWWNRRNTKAITTLVKQITPDVISKWYFGEHEEGEWEFPRMCQRLKAITDGLLKTALAMKDANKNYDAAHKVWVKGMMDMRQAAGTL